MELRLGAYYAVKIIKLTSSGAVVEMSDGTTEMIHISNISEDYVKRCSDYVTVGDILIANCVKGNSRPLQLSLKLLNLPNRTAARLNNRYYNALAYGHIHSDNRKRYNANRRDKFNARSSYFSRNEAQQ